MSDEAAADNAPAKTPEAGYLQPDAMDDSSAKQGAQSTPFRRFVRKMWDQYGLIVVGNIVFFALLYFLNYRPNSRENRAGELLSMAQRQEAEMRLQAAEVLYEQILLEYEDTHSASMARERLPKVHARAKREQEKQPPLPAACEPTIDVKDVLEQRPSFYVAELLGGLYPEVEPSERERYFDVLDGYVWQAFNRDGIAFEKMSDSPSFKAGALRQRYFTPKLRARFEPDVIYDDFKVKNHSFFPLHNVVIELTVKQDEDSETESVRVPVLRADEEIDLLEFNVAEDGGSVLIEGTVVADEAKKHTWTQRL